jgi:hypothetical protein
LAVLNPMPAVPPVTRQCLLTIELSLTGMPAETSEFRKCYRD